MRGMALNDLVKGLLGELDKLSKSSTIVGEVREAGPAQVVPLNKVSVAFGTGIGGGEGKHAGKENATDADMNAGGAGGAMMVEPRAFVVIDEDGQPYMLALGKRKQRPEVRYGIEIGSADRDAALPKKKDAPKLPAKSKKTDK
jgi:uncharacterized spore protein YtfJ